jgi:hypothetical protein
MNIALVFLIVLLVWSLLKKKMKKNSMKLTGKS